jgi:hypothetical protein
MQLDARWDSSGRVISPSERHLPTQDNTTFRQDPHRRRAYGVTSTKMEKRKTHTCLRQWHRFAVSMQNGFIGRGCRDVNCLRIITMCERKRCLRPTQPPVQWVLSPGVKRGRGVMLTTHPLLVPRSSMSRSYTSSPPSAFMACSGTALALASSYCRKSFDLWHVCSFTWLV